MPEAWDSRPPPIDHQAPRARPRRVLRGLAVVFFGVMALVGCLLVGLFAWVSYSGSDIERAKAEALAAAAGSNDHGCLAKAMERIQADPPFLFSLREGTFLLECLAHSEATESFCEGAPTPYTSEANLEFGTSKCQSLDLEEGPCVGLFTQVSIHCAQRQPAPSH